MVFKACLILPKTKKSNTTTNSLLNSLGYKMFLWKALKRVLIKSQNFVKPFFPFSLSVQCIKMHKNGQQEKICSWTTTWMPADLILKITLSSRLGRLFFSLQSPSISAYYQCVLRKYDDNAMGNKKGGIMNISKAISLFKDPELFL